MTDYEFQRVLTAWLQVGAVLVAAIALLFSLAKARFERRSALLAIAHEGLMKFIELSARHPNLCLLEPEKRTGGELRPEDQVIERSAYLLLLMAYERAFRFLGSGKRRPKLRKIESLIVAYAGVPRFRESVELYLSFSDDRFTGHLRTLLGIPLKQALESHT
jgi:hypothetical protein